MVGKFKRFSYIVNVNNNNKKKMTEIQIIQTYLHVKEIANSCNLSFDLVHTETPSPIYMLSNKYYYVSNKDYYEQGFIDIESALHFIQGYQQAYNLSKNNNDT